MSDALTMQIGGTHLCHHGIMAALCAICPIEKERDAARAEIAALKAQLDAATATFDDEQAAHQETLALWQQAKAEIASLTEQRDTAIAHSDNDRSRAKAYRAGRDKAREQRDRAMKALRFICVIDASDASLFERVEHGRVTLAALDTPSSPSLPESPEA